MTTRMELTYCGMSGAGATVKEAKQDAARKIESLIDQMHVSPRVIQLDGVTAIVFRGINGWSHGLISCAQEASRDLCHSVSGDDRASAIYSAVHHVATIAWTHATNDAVLIARAVEIVAYSDRGRLERELRDYFAWQRRYRVAFENGATDGEAHRIASEGR